MNKSNSTNTADKSNLANTVSVSLISQNEIKFKRYPRGMGLILNFVKERLMAILTIVAIVLGFVIGFTVRLANPSPDTIMWLGFPGQMFLNLLTMPIVPLVASSVITATASMSPKENGKVGVLYMAYVTISNMITTLLGLILCASIRPGSQMDAGVELRHVDSEMTTMDLAADMVRNLLPSNIVRAALQKEVTGYTEVSYAVEISVNASSNSVNASSILNQTSTLVETGMERRMEYIDSTNVLGLIFISVVFGLATGKAKEKGEPFLNFFRATLDIIMIVLDWFLWTAPIGILSLIAASIADIDDLSVMFVKLGMFVVTVVAGLAIHQLILLPLAHLALVRTNPFRVHAISMKAWCMGFAASSSAGAMPYMYIAATHMKVADKVSSLCIPMGVTFNANGSSIFISSAILFLAQINSISLGASHLMTVFMLVAVSSMALPAVPSASLVLIVILCTVFNIPVQSVGLLFAVEWFLDRIRTTGNILSEMFDLAFTWNWVKTDFIEKIEAVELDDVISTGSRDTIKKPRDVHDVTSE